MLTIGRPSTPTSLVACGFVNHWALSDCGSANAGVALARLPARPLPARPTEATPAQKERGRAAGATGWLVKPFHPDTLRRTVRQTLAERG